VTDRASDMPHTEYILGHSGREMQRLTCHAAILRPFTGRLVRGAGIGRGRRVLDRGCCAGDVSMLAAELVGGSGSVVGWVADSVESLVPQLARVQVLTADTIAIETLETRIRDDVLEARSQVVGPTQFCARTRVSIFSRLDNKGSRA
jgi:hypothetical protein